jgi:hypothetical protein
LYRGDGNDLRSADYVGDVFRDDPGATGRSGDDARTDTSADNAEDFDAVLSLRTSASLYANRIFVRGRGTGLDKRVHFDLITVTDDAIADVLSGDPSCDWLGHSAVYRQSRIVRTTLN